MSDSAGRDDIARHLAIGTWGLGGRRAGRNDAYGEVSEATCHDVLDLAWASGIRVADTAPAYGGGQAYERLAAWSARTGLRFEVVAKPGRPLVGGRPESRLELDRILVEIDDAERLLGAPRWVLIKDPPAEALRDGTVERLLDDLGSRLDATLGLASHVPEACLALGHGCGERVVMLEVHAVNHVRALPVARRLGSRGWRVWGMQPLAYGLLAGTYDVGHAFPRWDWRARIPAETRDSIVRLGAGTLAPLSRAAPGASAAQLALAFCLGDEELERVVVGPKSCAQLRDVLVARELARDAELLGARARLTQLAAR